MTVDNNNRSYYETKNLNVAAYLLATGKVTLRGTRKDEFGNVHLQFTPPHLATDLIHHYWAKTDTPMPAYNLFSSLYDVKSLVHKEKNEQH